MLSGCRKLKVQRSNILFIIIGFVFLLPYPFFIDESIRYISHAVFSTSILFLIIIFNFNKISLDKKGFIFLLYIIIFVFLGLLSIIYGLTAKGVDVKFTDFSDILIYVLILFSFLIGIVLYKSGCGYWFLNKLFEIVVLFNFTITSIQFVSPHILDGNVIEFIISLYAPLDAVNKYYWRGTGTLGQAGQFGLAMVFMYAFFLAQYYTWKKVRPLIFCMVIFISIIISGTKAAVIECTIISFFSYVLSSINNKNLSVKLLKSALLISLIIFCLPKAFDSLNYLSKNDGVKLSLVRDDPLSGMHHRNKTKLAALDLVSRESILFGFGPAKNYFDSLGTLDDGVLNLRNPDSSFSLIIIRYGFVGLILSFLFYCYMYFYSFSLFVKYRLKNKKISSLSLTYFSCLFAYFIAYWMDPILNMTSYIIWFYVGLGVLFSYSREYQYRCRNLF